jgi:hypothetical protein
LVCLPEAITSFNTVINHYIPDYKPLYILVGGFNPLEKYILVSWDDYPPIYYGKKMFEPPTSFEIWQLLK